MIRFRPAPNPRSALLSPPPPRAGAVASRMGQAGSAPPPPPLPLVLAAGAAGLAFVGATGWVGIRAGLREKGWLSALGWTAGIGGILFGGFFFSLPVSAAWAAISKGSK
jgi:hypothetical protein